MQSIYFTLFSVKLKSAEEIFQSHFTADEKEKGLNLLLSFQTRCLKTFSSTPSSSPTGALSKLHTSISLVNPTHNLDQIRAVQEDIAYEATIVSNEMCTLNTSTINSQSTNKFIAESINKEIYEKIVRDEESTNTLNDSFETINTEAFRTLVNQNYNRTLVNLDYSRSHDNFTSEKPYTCIDQIDHSDDCSNVGNEVVIEEESLHSQSNVKSVKKKRKTKKKVEKDPSVPKRTRRRNIIHVCKKCDLTFESGKAYREHMKSSHSIINFKCDKCGMGFYFTRQYNNHMESHQEYNCTTCEKLFHSFTEYSDHCQVQHAINVSKVDLMKIHNTCKLCDKSFDTPSRLYTHHKKHHTEGPIMCKPCQQIFSTRLSLRNHEKSYAHHKKSGQKFTLERNLLCSDCGKSFYSKSNLATHMKYHKSEKKYACEHCNFKCYFSARLKTHIKQHFDSERRFVCETCGAAFHTNQILQSHIGYKHSDARNFCCHICSSTFKGRNALTRHIKEHSIENHKKCFCGRTFSRIGALRQHMEKVHSENATEAVRRRSMMRVKNSENKTDLLTKKSRKKKKKLTKSTNSKMSKSVGNTDISAAVKKITDSKFKPIKSSAEKPVQHVQGICIANFKYAPLDIINQASNTLMDENIIKNSGEITKAETFDQSEHAKNNQLIPVQPEKNDKLPLSSTDLSMHKQNSFLKSNVSDTVKTEPLSFLKEKTVENPKQNTFVESAHSYRLFCIESDHNYSNMSNGQSEQIEKLPVSKEFCIIPKQKYLLQTNVNCNDQNEAGRDLQNKKIEQPKLILPKGPTNYSQFGPPTYQPNTISSNILQGQSTTSYRFNCPLVLPQNTSAKTPLLILWRPPPPN
ncbi:zinc finger protein 791-like [Mytilus trossulus]|uniref:zinc finger protein 791-like n=1 Tax=Mytilus trossulus TaxID=6551 RepID=UPI0030075A87